MSRRCRFAAFARIGRLARLGGAVAAAAVLGACAARPGAEADRIVDVATGQALTPAQVMQRVRAADVVLLGELHDNAHHHARRATLLDGLHGPAPVVAEHLVRGAAPALPRTASGETLRQALVAAGFDARSWRWPLHEPLFAAVARAGHALRGGNLEREAVRRLVREGAGAMPAELRPLLEAAPLDAAARSGLEWDLLRGHCGHLGPERMPGMVRAQRGRDAAMAAAAAAALDERRRAAAGGPVVLLAGNGHVRRDYGVPQLLGRLRPGARMLSIALLEPGDDAGLPGGTYDIAWITPAAEREDPCKAFGVPRTGAPAERTLRSQPAAGGGAGAFSLQSLPPVAQSWRATS